MKKVLIVFLTIFILTFTAITVSANEFVPVGDTNEDDIINTDDAVYILRCAAGIEEYSSNLPKYIGDIDLDGKISTTDAREILRIAAGISEPKSLEFSDWSVAVESTCTSHGEAVSHSLKGNYIRTKALPLLPHKIVEANCIKGVHCSECSEVFSEPTYRHTESDWIIDVMPTCIYEGYKYKVCTVCNEMLSDMSINKTAHTLIVVEETQPTCTEHGLTSGIRCSVCNMWETEQQYIEPKGHTESDWIIDTSATCTKSGTMHTECTECGDTVKATAIPATGHTPIKDNAVAATCTATGKTEGSHCAVCNAVIKAQSTTPAKGHTKVTDSPAIEPTCTTAGKTESSHCSVCNIVIETQKTIPATGHTSIKDNAVAATCTTAGKTEGSHCAVCNAVIKAQQTIPATGHTSSDWIIDKPATNTSGASKHKECLICGTILETIAADPFIIIDDKVIPFGTTASDLIKLLGNPTEILNDVAKSYNIKYYVYAGDYSKLTIFTFTDDLGIIGVYSVDPSYKVVTKETISYDNVAEVYLSGNVYFEAFIDKLGTGEVYAFFATTVKETNRMYADTNFRSCEKLIFHTVNACRAINGVKAVKYSDPVAAVALSHSKDMADNDYFNHTNLDGLSPLDRLVNGNIDLYGCGENIAAGTRMSPYSFNNAWYNSEGHRGVMLSNKYTHLGIGIAYNEASAYDFYATENYTFYK